MKQDDIFRAIFRIVFAIFAALIAIGFLGNSQEFLGLVALLVCFSIVVRGASEVILMFAFTLIPFVLALVIFWSPFGVFEDIGFIDWLSEYWYTGLFYLCVAIFLVVRQFSNRGPTWDILSETYGASRRSEEELKGLPYRVGALSIVGDFIPVTIYQVTSGFLVTSDGVAPLLFPWNRIVNVSRRSGNLNRAILHLRKNMGPPLEVEIPWSPMFRVNVGGIDASVGT